MTARRLRPALAALSLVALTACGSTVQLRTNVGPQPQGLGVGSAGPSGSGVASGSEPLTGAAAGTTSPVAAAGGSTTGAVSGGSGTPLGNATGTPGGSGPAADGARLFGPGVTATQVRIGYQYVDTGTGTSGFLGKNVSIGNPDAMAHAVQAWINAHGGMGGRKLVLDIYGVAYNTYISNPAQADEQVCSH
jgi:hypothetical protein